MFSTNTGSLQKGEHIKDKAAKALLDNAFNETCDESMIGVCIGYPLDTIKLNIQTRNPKNPHYQGTLKTFRHLLEKEGVRTLFRGITSPLVCVGVINGILFGIYGSVKRLMPEPESITAISVAGTASALGTVIIISPVEMTKSRMQVAGEMAGRNPLHCLLILYRKEGIYKGVFKGLGLTTVREIPSNVSYFIVYEYLTIKLRERKPSLLLMFNAGGLAGMASWLIPYPIDIIKSKIQVDGARGVIKYKNWYDCYKKTIELEGYRGLYRGVLPTVVRAFPIHGVTFVVVNLILRFYGADEFNITESSNIKHKCNHKKL